MYRINVKSVDIYLGLHDKILTIATLGSVMSSNNVNNLAHSGASAVTAPSSATLRRLQLLWLLPSLLFLMQLFGRQWEARLLAEQGEVLLFRLRSHIRGNSQLTTYKRGQFRRLWPDWINAERVQQLQKLAEMGFLRSGIGLLGYSTLALIFVFPSVFVRICVSYTTGLHEVYQKIIIIFILVLCQENGAG